MGLQKGSLRDAWDALWGSWAALWAHYGHFWADVGAIMAPSAALERHWVAQGAPVPPIVKNENELEKSTFFSMPPCFVSSAGCHCGVDLMAVPSGFIRTPGDCIKEGIGNIVFVYNGS